MIDRCNDMGVDTIDAGNMMAMAMEMSEEGKLEEGDLEWGDYETMIDMIERIAHREDDLADLLAEGPRRVAEAKDAEENSLAVKGQTIAAYDPRCLKGMGIGYATSNRGACHLRGYTPLPKFWASQRRSTPTSTRARANSPRSSRTSTPSATPSTSASSTPSPRESRSTSCSTTG